jgi:hypothetical protein
MMNKTQGKIMQRIIKEKDLTKTKIFAFPQNHPFYKVFEEKIQQMVTGGILEHIINDYNSSVNPKRFAHLNVEKVQPINVEHLEAGFVIWLISLVFPIIAFMIEWIVHLKTPFIFWYCFNSYMKELERVARSRQTNLQFEMMLMTIHKSETMKVEEIEIYG